MAILQKRVDIFFPHCLNAKLCFCTHVEHCMRIILTEIKGINDNYVIGGGCDIDLFTTELLG